MKGIHPGKILFLVVTTLILSSPLNAQALKMGIVDIQEALNGVNEGKQAKARLKAQFEQKQQALNSKQNELKKLKETLEAQKSVLSKEALQQKAAKYQDLFIQFQRDLAKSRQEMASKEVEMTKSIIEKLMRTVGRIGKKEGFDVIFEKSGQSVLFAPKAENLTSKVIKAFNSGR